MLLPSATMMAPVSVARLTMNFGWKRSLAYQSASASTSRPSASVLSTSIVWPDIEVTMSPGRCALPSSMFSTKPMMPTALTLALRAASACIRPVTAAAPPMSPFMSSMPAAGLIEMPPESKTTPLPTKATGLSFGLPPFHCMTTRRGGLTEPCATPSSAPMPSFFISFSVRTSTLTPSASSSLALAANSTGPSTLAGSLTRSRASTTPSATASASAKAFLAAVAAALTIVSLTLAGSSPLSASSFLVRYLSKR